MLDVLTSSICSVYLGSIDVKSQFDALIDPSKVIVFFKLQPHVEVWCQRNISNWTIDRVTVISQDKQTHAALHFYLSLEDDMDRTAWALRPDELLETVA
jgi:hypothetical protein